MPSKYFRNPYLDYNKEIGKQLICNKSGHTHLNPQNKISLNLSERWLATLRKFQRIDIHDNSIYSGTSGIALLKFKKDPDSVENLHYIKTLLRLDKLRYRSHSFLCGDGGPLAIGIVVNYKLGNKEELDQLIIRLKSLDKDVLNVYSDLSNEYLHGRVGYLFALLFVNKYVQPPPFDEVFIRPIIKAIIVSGVNMARAAKSKCPLMYQWHGSYYLGAGHGLAGILYLLLQARQYLTENELSTQIKPTIEYLSTLKFPSGNFPSSLGKDNEYNDKYVQWCHGAPGFLFLFAKAYKVFQNPTFLKIALRCGDIIWERGLVKKGYSICHGVAGNAYAFLELYQTTKNEKHLYRAIKFAEWCFDGKREHEHHYPESPLSLYEGISGPMYLFLDLQKPLEAKFPGFTL